MRITKLLSAVLLSSVALACTPSNKSTSQITIKMPGDNLQAQSKKLSQSVSALGWNEMCYLVNITGASAPTKKKNACEIEKGITTDFIPAGGSVNLTIPQGLGYKLQLLGFERASAGDPCPTLNSGKDLELLNTSIKELAVKSFDAVGEKTPVTLNAVIPANDIKTQYSLSSNCTSLGSFTLSTSSFSVNENAGSATINVNLSIPAPAPLTVSYSLLGVTASAGIDIPASGGTVNFSAGQTTAALTIPIFDDAVYEGANETFTVSITPPAGYSLGAVSSATGTIIEDEPYPTVQWDLSTNSVSESTGTLALTVNISPVSSTAVMVPFSVSGTADNSDHDAPLSGSISIGSLASSGTLTVNIASDSLYEDNETVIFSIGAPIGATVGTTAVHTLTIMDDDTAPTVSVTNNPNVSESGGSNLSFHIDLSQVSGKDVTVDYATSDGTALAGSDYSSTSGTATILAGQTRVTILVPVLDDTIYEGTQDLTFTISNPINAAVATAAQLGYINDDDSPPTVQWTTASSEINEGNAVNLVAQLSAVSELPTTVPFTVPSSSYYDAGNGSDYTLSVSSPLVIPAGQLSASTLITTVIDGEEIKEIATFTIASPLNATLGATSVHTLTIRDSTPYIWTGAAGDGNWLNATNWNTNTVPSTGNLAIFDNHCINCNVSLSSSININGLVIKNPYTGTFNQNSFTITIGTDGFQVFGGTFNAGAADISVNSTTTFGGGIINLSSTNKLITKDVEKVNAPTVNHNNGTVKLSTGGSCSNVLIRSGSIRFYHLEIAQTCSNDFTLDFNQTPVLYVDGDLILSAPTTKLNKINGNSRVEVKRNLLALNFAGGSALIKLVGSTTQTINQSLGILPSLELAGFGASYGSALKIEGGFKRTAGTMTANTFLTTVVVPAGCAATSIGNVAVSDLRLENNCGGAATLNILSDVNARDLIFSAANPLRLDGSALSVNRNLLFAGGNDWLDGGTATIALTGSATQNLSGFGGANGKYPNLRFMGGGAATYNVSSLIRVAGNFEHLSGNFNFGSSIVNMLNDTGNATLTSAFPLNFNELVIGSPSGVGSFNIVGPMPIVTGPLRFVSTAQCYPLIGDIDSRGGLDINCPSASPGSGTIFINGGGSWSQTSQSPAFRVVVNFGPVFISPISNINVSRVDVQNGTLHLQGSVLSVTQLFMSLGTVIDLNDASTSGQLWVNGAPQSPGPFGSGSIQD